MMPLFRFALLLLATATALVAPASRVRAPVRSTTIDVEPLAPSAEDAAAARCAEAKEALLAAVRGTDRGFDRGGGDAVRAAIKALEAARAGPSGALDGEWTLAWTDAPDILSLRSPLATLGRIGQEIDAGAGTIVNVIEWSPPAFAARLPGLARTLDDVVQQRVVTAFVQDGDAVELTLKGAGARPKRLFGRDAGGGPLDVVGPLSLPFGSFDVLFNDGDLRVVRTNSGFVSVNVRRMPGGGGGD